MYTKGILILKCTDIVTGKIRTETISNVLTRFNINLADVIKPATGGWWNERYMHFTDVKITPGNKDVTKLISDHVEDSKGLQRFPILDAFNDFYQEITSTFLSTGSVETINTIFVSDSNSSSNNNSFDKNVYSYASLVTPFNKGANEVLQITYRYSIDTNTIGYDDRLRVVRDFILAGAASCASNHNYFNQTKLSTVPYNFYPQYLWINDGNELITFTGTDTRIANNPKVNANFVLTKPDLTGKVLRTTCLVSNDNSVFPSISNGINTIAPIVVDNNNQIKFFLSPLLNHTNNTTIIYEDFNNLATGLGYPLVRMSNPFNEYPEARSTAYFIHITKTGNKGVARYVYHIEPVIEEFSELGCCFGKHPMQYVLSGTHSTSRAGQTGDLYTNIDYPSKTGTTSLSCYKQLVTSESYSSNPDISDTPNSGVFQYNLQYSVIISNDTVSSNQQICFVDWNNSQNVIYYGTNNSSPGHPILIKAKLDLTAHQMTRDDNGNLYYVTNEGICKITDPLGSAVLNYYTNIQIGLLVTDTVYSLNSNNNTIFVITENKISYSDDMINWTVINTTRLSNDITDSQCSITNNGNLFFIGISDNYSKIINITTDTVIQDIGVVKPRWISLVSFNNKLLGNSFIRYNDSTYYNYVLENNTILTVKQGHGNSYNYCTIPVLPDKLGNYSLMTYGKCSSTNNIVSGLFTLNGVLLTIRYSGESVLAAKYAKAINQENSYKQSISDGLDINDVSYYAYSGIGQSLQQHNFNRPGVIEENDPSFPNLFINNIKGISTVYRWDTSTNQWKPDWNADSPATTDGLSNLPAKRHNFHTDSNRFNSWASLDISDAFNSASYTNGMTVAMTVNPETKLTPEFDTTWISAASKEDPLTCLIEITDTINDVSIALMMIGTTNRTVFIDNTNPIAKTQFMTEIDLEVVPPFAQRRYTMTVSSDGTTVEVYRDGNLIGSTITLTNPFVMNSSYEVSIGSRNRSYFGFQPYKGCCAKGTIENIQVCNRLWSTQEILDDSNTPLGIVNPSNTVVRYLMTADYGEGKVCDDATWQPISGGLEIKFPDGNLSSDSYVANEYYNTFKTEGGLVKTNTETMTIKASISVSGDSVNTATSIVNGSNTAPNSSGTVTELAVFDYNHNSSADEAVTVGCVSQTYPDIVRFIDQAGDGGDLVFEWINTYSDGNYKIRISDVSVTTDSVDVTTGHYQLEIQNTSGLEFTDGTGTITTNATNIASGDRLRLTYIASNSNVQLALYDSVNSIWNDIGSPVSVSGIINPSVSFVGYLSGSVKNIAGINNATITYNCDSRYMRLGDKITQTGQYSPNFFKVLSQYDTGHFQINGVDAVVIYNDEYERMFSVAEPAVGTIALSRGHIMLNSADRGKLININNVTVHYG